MAPKSSDSINQTRERIIQAAFELFHARSYDGVGVQEICDTAEVTKGSFYHFFPSKDDLAIAVIDTVWAHAEQEMQQLIDPAVPPLTRIEQFFEGIHVKVCSMKEKRGRILGCPIGNLTSELSTQNEAIRQRLVCVYDNMCRYFEHALRDAAACGQILPDTDVTVAARSMVAFLQGMAVLGKAYNNPDMIPRLAQHAMALAAKR